MTTGPSKIGRVAVDDNAGDAVAVDHDVVTAALDEHVAAHRPTADDEWAVAVIDDGAGEAQATGDGVGADVAFESADDDVRFRRRGAHHDGSGAGDVDRMEAERPRADHAAENESGWVCVCRRSSAQGEDRVDRGRLELGRSDRQLTDRLDVSGRHETRLAQVTTQDQPLVGGHSLDSDSGTSRDRRRLFLAA